MPEPSVRFEYRFGVATTDADDTTIVVIVARDVDNERVHQRTASIDEARELLELVRAGADLRIGPVVTTCDRKRLATGIERAIEAAETRREILGR